MRRTVSFLFVGAFVLSLAAPAHAAAASTETGPRGNVVVLDGRTVIAESDVVNSVVVFHGRTIVQGLVRGSVVVFDGVTTISGTVRGSVYVFRGHVDVTSGAHIRGDLVTNETPDVANGAQIDGRIRHVSNINFTGYSFAFHFIVWVAYTISVLALGLLLLALLPGPYESAARAAVDRVGASIGWGALLLFGLPLAAVLVMVSLVGIPLGLSLLLACWFLFTAGYTVGAFAIGRMLVKPPSGRFKAFFAGWGICRAAALIPVVGGLAWIGVAILGLGAVCVAVWRSRRATHDADHGIERPPPGPLLPAPPPVPSS